MTDTMMLRETREAAEVVRRSLDNTEAADALAQALSTKAGPITTAARGSSDHAAAGFKYLCEILLGRPVASIGPSIASVYQSSLKLTDGVHITVSQSGASPDIVELQSAAKRGGARTFAVVNAEGSPLAQAADQIVPLNAGPEKSVAATKSFIASCVALYAATAKAAGDQQLLAGLRQLPEALSAIDAGKTDTLAQRLAGERAFFVTARGPTFPVALEAALKAKETAGIHAEAFSGAELMHGPLQLVQPAFPIIAFVADDAAGGSMLATIERLRSIGGDVLTVSTSDLDGGLRVTGTGHPWTDGLVFIAAWYLTIEKVTRLCGLDPDRPTNLRKVTETV